MLDASIESGDDVSIEQSAEAGDGDGFDSRAADDGLNGARVKTTRLPGKAEQ